MAAATWPGSRRCSAWGLGSEAECRSPSGVAAQPEAEGCRCCQPVERSRTTRRRSERLERVSGTLEDWVLDRRPRQAQGRLELTPGRWSPGRLPGKSSGSLWVEEQVGMRSFGSCFELVVTMRRMMWMKQSKSLKRLKIGHFCVQGWQLS